MGKDEFDDLELKQVEEHITRSDDTLFKDLLDYTSKLQDELKTLLEQKRQLYETVAIFLSRLISGVKDHVKVVIENNLEAYRIETRFIENQRRDSINYSRMLLDRVWGDNQQRERERRLSLFGKRIDTEEFQEVLELVEQAAGRFDSRFQPPEKPDFLVSIDSVLCLARETQMRIKELMDKIPLEANLQTELQKRRELAPPDPQMQRIDSLLSTLIQRLEGIKKHE